MTHMYCVFIGIPAVYYFPFNSKIKNIPIKGGGSP